MFMIWITSTILALASLLLMSTLIASRLIEGGRAAARKASEDTARRAFVAFAGHPDETALLAALGGIDRAIIAEQVSDVLCLVRGEILPRLRNVLGTLKIPAYEQKRLRQGLLPIRVAAAEFLANFQDAVTADALRAALSDRSTEVRIAAAISLTRRGDSFDLRALLIVLQASHVQSKRLIELFEVLVTLEPEQIVPLLQDDALGDGIKALAIDGMCRTKSPVLVGHLNDLITSTESSVISAAVIRSSAALGHPQSLAIIARHLDSKDAILRLAAAEAAGLLRVPNPDLLRKLVKLLRSDEWTIRLAASSSLLALGTDGRTSLNAATARGANLRSISNAPLVRASKSIISG